MTYVFDSGPLIILFSYYYPDRFPKLWEQFRRMVADGAITSTREVKNELERQEDELKKWCKLNKSVFVTPTAEESKVVSEIFRVTHFQGMIKKKKLLEGQPWADPFVIARAKCLPDGCVVTSEKYRKHAAKIPNVCEHFRVDCTDLEGFMERENWRF